MFRRKKRAGCENANCGMREGWTSLSFIPCTHVVCLKVYHKGDRFCTKCWSDIENESMWRVFFSPCINKWKRLNLFFSVLFVYLQSRALNGWARLVIGLLNRMYRDEELELRAKQLLYMRDREELLDEQLMSHKDVTHHQSDASFVQANTSQLLQVWLRYCRSSVCRV